MCWQERSGRCCNAFKTKFGVRLPGPCSHNMTDYLLSDDGQIWLVIRAGLLRWVTYVQPDMPVARMELSWLCSSKHAQAMFIPTTLRQLVSILIAIPFCSTGTLSLSPPLIFSSFIARMSGNNAHRDDDAPESDSATGQKRGRPSALQLGPRKKPSVS